MNETDHEIGYLYREKREDDSPRQEDVKVVYSKEVDSSAGFRVQIADGPKDELGRILIYLHYALFKSFENAERNPDCLGAEVVEPPIQPDGTFLSVGDELAISLA